MRLSWFKMERLTKILTRCVLDQAIVALTRPVLGQAFAQWRRAINEPWIQVVNSTDVVDLDAMD